MASSEQVLLHAGERLYLNEHMADVHFTCTDKDGTITCVPAHKVIISTASATFLTQFFGSLPDESEIQIEDEFVTTEAFKLFLKYLYCATVQLDREQAPKLLYLAKKYLMKSLEDECKSFLRAELAEYSDWCLQLLHYLHAALGERESTLMETVLQLIEDNGHAAVTSDAFSELSAELVSLIVRRDTLDVDELTLYTMVIKWSQRECERRELTLTLTNQRAVLQGILSHIRFTAVSRDEFCTMMNQCRILPDDVALNIVLAADKTTLPFNSQPRKKLIKLVYIIGGCVNGSISASVRTYNLDEGCKLTQMQMNKPRAWHCATYCHAAKQIMVIGSDDDDDDDEAVSAEMCTLTDEGSVFITMTIKQRRNGASCISIGTKVYVMGGRGTQRCDCYDVQLDTWADIAWLPHNVSHACCVLYEEGDKTTILLIGGKNAHSGNVLQTVMQYWPDENQWTDRPDLRLPTTLHCSSAVNWKGTVVVVSGATDTSFSTVTNECYSLDRVNKKWVSMPNMITKRCEHQAVVVGGKIVVMGGRDKGVNTLKSVEVFDREQWTDAHELDATMYSFAALAV